jgi:hypothetical protein
MLEVNIVVKIASWVRMLFYFRDTFCNQVPVARKYANLLVFISLPLSLHIESGIHLATNWSGEQDFANRTVHLELGLFIVSQNRLSYTYVNWFNYWVLQWIQNHKNTMQYCMAVGVYWCVRLAQSLCCGLLMKGDGRWGSDTGWAALWFWHDADLVIDR